MITGWREMWTPGRLRTESRLGWATPRMGSPLSGAAGVAMVPRSFARRAGRSRPKSGQVSHTPRAAVKHGPTLASGRRYDSMARDRLTHAADDSGGYPPAKERGT